MPRVLLETFGAIAGLGLRAILKERDYDIIGESDVDELLSKVIEVRPDVLILDLESPGGPELAKQVVAHHPEITVIVCSTEQPLMHVYPRFGGGVSYACTLTVPQLIRAIAD